MVSLRVLLTLAAVLATTHATSASACPASAMSMRPITTKNVTMLPDGGVLLGVSRSYGNRANGAYSLVDETGTAIDAEEELLAPGLVRLTPKQHADRELTLLEGGKRVFELQDAAGAPALATIPKIAKVTSTRARNAKPPRGPYPISATTTITLAAPPPADVVGIVLYGADKTARAWLPTYNGKRYLLSFGGKGCGSVGMSGTVIGEDVMFAFVDSGGRVSAQSKLVRVGRTPPPPKPPAPPTPPITPPKATSMNQ